MTCWNKVTVWWKLHASVAWTFTLSRFLMYDESYGNNSGFCLRSCTENKNSGFSFISFTLFIFFIIFYARHLASIRDSRPVVFCGSCAPAPAPCLSVFPPPVRRIRPGACATPAHADTCEQQDQRSKWKIRGAGTVLYGLDLCWLVWSSVIAVKVGRCHTEL